MIVFNELTEENLFLYAAKHYRNPGFTDIEELLLEESTYEENEITEICNFLKKLLVYNPKLRLSSKQCYDDSWLKNLST